MSENFYVETRSILRQLLISLTALNTRLENMETADSLTDDDIEDAWEGDEQ